MDFCFSCQKQDFECVNYVDHHFQKNGHIEWSDYQICFCINCGFGYISPSPNHHKLKQFYENAYRIDPSSVFHTKQAKISLLKEYRVNHSFLAQAITASLFAEPTDTINFLDIGCGPSGDSFYTFKKIFQNKTVNLYGIDPDPITKSNLSTSGIQVIGEDVSVLSDQRFNNYFNIVLMSHSLEHFILEDLKSFLITLDSILQPGGIAIIEVPNDDFRLWENRKLYPSAPHTLFFSLESLHNLFCNSGFHVLHSGAFGNKKSYPSITANTPSKTTKKIPLTARLSKLIPIKSKIWLKSKLNQYRSDPFSLFKTNELQQEPTGAYLRIVAKKQSTKQGN